MNEPERLREILPDVMQNIRKRMELHHQQKKILSAVSDFYQNHRSGRPHGRRRVFERKKQKMLF